MPKAMTKHEAHHDHHDHCEHKCLKFCHRCNKPYCADCGEEWEARPKITYAYTNLSGTTVSNTATCHGSTS